MLTDRGGNPPGTAEQIVHVSEFANEALLIYEGENRSHMEAALKKGEGGIGREYPMCSTGKGDHQGEAQVHETSLGRRKCMAFFQSATPEMARQAVEDATNTLNMEESLRAGAREVSLPRGERFCVSGNSN